MLILGVRADCSFKYSGHERFKKLLFLQKFKGDKEMSHVNLEGMRVSGREKS